MNFFNPRCLKLRKLILHTNRLFTLPEGIHFLTNLEVGISWKDDVVVSLSYSDNMMDQEEWWFERAVKDAIWERVEAPSLNKKGGGVYVSSFHRIVSLVTSRAYRVICPNQPDEVRRFRTKRCYQKQFFMSSKRFKTFLNIYILDE